MSAEAKLWRKNGLRRRDMYLQAAGFYELKRSLDLLREAVASLDGKITTVQFDPHDQCDIERAIREMERAVVVLSSIFATIQSLFAEASTRDSRTEIGRAPLRKVISIVKTPGAPERKTLE